MLTEDMNTSLGPTWNDFFAEFDSRNRRLCSELEASWRNLESLIQSQIKNFNLGGWSRPEQGRLSSLAELLDGPGQAFLVEPMDFLRRLRPQARALSAIESYESGIEDLLRLLPETVTVSGAELVAMAGSQGGRSWRSLFLRFGSKPRRFRLRTVARNCLLKESLRRAKLEGNYLLLLARISLALLLPWQLVRHETFRALGGKEPDIRDMEKRRQSWLEMATKLTSRMAGVLGSYQSWKETVAGHIAGLLLRGEPNAFQRRTARLKERRQRYLSYWCRQQRAVNSLIELEFSLGGLIPGTLGISNDSLESLGAEHDQVIAGLDKVSEWLQDWQKGTAHRPFPEPEARLLSAEDRTAEWVRKTSAIARTNLPFLLESLEPRSALPGLRPPWRQLEVEKCFQKALERVGRARCLAGFKEAESGHSAVIREIERAREVVAFSMDAARAGDEEGVRVAADGIANALSLVSYHRQAAVDPRPLAEQRLTEALSGTFIECHLGLEQGRLGLLTHLARQTGTQIIRAVWRLALSWISVALRWLRDLVTRYYGKLLVKIGWSAPSAGAPEPVIRRVYLGEVLSLQTVARELPPIYRRLFRLDPVEDPRFLVGREAEMSALSVARRFWETGRAVSIIVIGARGSGKTSLLNCAVRGVLSDLQVVSGQFHERTRSADEMHAFLAFLLGAKSADLAGALTSKKRVILLEEVERTFIRTIGGFNGLRRLLELVSQTSRSTMWILSVNETAYRYLDRVVEMGQSFSHRINAMAVLPEHLRKAILLRHNLSGLRLQFASSPAARSRTQRSRQMLGLEKGPEQVFFDSLYRQSGGIFRSAFELWQQSVDRVEGGVLYMKDPREPSYESMVAGLTLQDSFTLHAILQHGGLTPEEHSQVFACAIDQSLAMLERLMAWEIVEPDPRNPGIRVRPEAGRLVREVLHRQNLL